MSYRCLALWHLQDAKELLYRLFRAGFVGMQEIPRTADHAPSRTLYTWRVDAAAAAEKLAADLYKAALNVRLRLEHEITQQSDVRLPLYFPKHWLQLSMLKSNCWHTETCVYTLQLVAAYWHGTDAQALCVLTIFV